MHENIFHHTDISNKTFLVTGGAGFIGGHIAEYLLKHHAKKVRVLDNMVNGFESTISILNKYTAFEFIKGDIRDFETCKKACDGIEYVSHQAALGSVPRSILEPMYFNDVNVGGFVNILKASIECNVKCFVYASSSSVYGDEISLPKKEDKVGNCLSPYAVTKKTNELYAQVFSEVYGIKLMGFRYFNIFGPRQNPNGPYAAVIPLFINGIKNKTPVYINGDGEQTRDFTYVDNAVQANIKGMFCHNTEAFNKVYNIAFGEKYSINQLFSLCANELNAQMKPIYRDSRIGDVRDSLADISLANKMLGYTPVSTFITGIINTIHHLNNN